MKHLFESWRGYLQKEELEAEYRWLETDPNVLELKNSRGESVGSVEKRGARWLVYDEENQEEPMASEYTIEDAKEALLDALDISDYDIMSEGKEEDDFEPHMMYDPKTGEQKEAKTKAEHEALGAKGWQHVDPDDIRKALEDEGGAAGTDAIVDRTDSSKEEVEGAMDNMPDVAQHKDGDYILGDDEKVKIEEDCWDGYERVPGSVEGEQGSCRKKTDEAVSPEQQEANEKAYSRCFEMGRKGVDVKTALRGGPVADFAACRAGHEDGANEFRQSLEEEIIQEDEICKAGKDWVDGKTIGGQLVKRGEDGKFNNWSARAAQIASKYCKDDNYGRGGKSEKNEGVTPDMLVAAAKWADEHGGKMMKDSDGNAAIVVSPDVPLSIKAADEVKEAGWEVQMKGNFVVIYPAGAQMTEGDLGDWEKENWTHSDGTPCGGGDKDGSQSRCKPASKWKGMSDEEKKADNAKKKAGTKAGKQYVPATKKGKVTKSHTKESREMKLKENRSPLESNFKSAVMDFIIEQMQTMGMNAGDPQDRERIKSQVMSIVGTAIQAIGLNEGTRMNESYSEFLSEEALSSFIDEFFIKEETDKERMKCNKPRYIREGEPGYGKKQKVVKACKDGKEKIIRFGDANMENKSDSADNKSNFRSRHNCDEKKDKFSAGYWSCKDW